MTEEKLKIEGAAKLRLLDSVKPNEWNPNVMSPREFDSLVLGMKEDGWIASQPLLIWGKDEQGTLQDLIIDGEHRWRGGKMVGYVKGPMVTLDGLTRAQAQALTVKLDQRRGEFDPRKLGTLLRELDGNGFFGEADVALTLGFEDEALELLLGEPEESLLDDTDAAGKQLMRPELESKNALVKQVPLYIALADHPVFLARIAELAKRFGTENISETIIAAVRELTK